MGVVTVPGRVNLIGEHVDYHDLPVLPIAIQRRVRIEFSPRADRIVCARSAGFGERSFEWTPRLEAAEGGDWVNYLKAAAQAVAGRWGVGAGIDAEVSGDLPPAAGLSSSSALLTGFVLALLQASGIRASFEELMQVLPEGEHFVGTRGGGMDHAAVLASKAGYALLVRFAPLSVEHVPIPGGWSFLMAHSLTTAEKSGAVRAEYNSRRTAGTRALAALGFGSYGGAIDDYSFEELDGMARARLEGEERRAFSHVVGEAFRVRDAVKALRRSDAEAFGRALDASHESLRYRLQISNDALDTVVAIAREAGALGARLTGAGFGGFVVVFSEARLRERIAEELVRRYYSLNAGFNPAVHLFAAEASAGALES